MQSPVKTAEEEFGMGGLARSCFMRDLADRAAERASVARHSYSLWRRWLLNAFVILSSDTCALGLAGAAVAALRLPVLGHLPLSTFMIALVPAWWLVAAAGNLVPGWGLSSADHLRRQVSLLTGLFALGAVLILFFLPGGHGHREGFCLFWLLAVVLVPVGRTIARGLLCSRKLFGARTVVFGETSFAREVAEHLRDNPALGYQAIGVCCPGGAEAGGLPIIGRLSEARPLAPVAIVVVRGLSEETSRQLIVRAMTTYRKLLIIPDLTDAPSMWTSPRDIDGRAALEISHALLSPVATTVKRIMDVALVLAAAPLWVPLCCLIALCILIEDRHAPVFRQERAGRDGRNFHAFKFRTMVTDAEAVLARYLEADPALKAEWEAEFKLRRDPRVTRVGRFLRRTSLDELPQLLNVLMGKMALVGPRPLPEYHLRRLPEEAQNVRAQMLPGMTGLWQVSGRSDAGTDGMARWDPYYVRNWSIWLDIIILVRTIRVVVLASGAR